jgi:phosphate transport system substrate-binding protein
MWRSQVSFAFRPVALLPAALVGSLLLSANGKANVPIAVIAHEQVPVNGLSLAELRRIFRGEQRFWSRYVTITLLMPPRGSRERKVLLDKIYEQRSESQVQHYWINKLFDDPAQTSPKITGSTQMSASLARAIPGAIALVPADHIPPGVKVLRIDGKLPGDPGYPLVPSG